MDGAAAIALADVIRPESKNVVDRLHDMGIEAAMLTGDSILVKSNPMAVVNVVELSRASYRKMIQNLWWAAGYNIAALPLAAGVLAPVGILLSPAVGGLAHVTEHGHRGRQRSIAALAPLGA